MNYETATDLELNKALFPASRDYLKCEDVMEKQNPNRSGFMWGDGVNWFDFNPCNNWNDIMPIVVKLKIGLMINWHVADIWSGVANSSSNKFDFSSESPQRALVICCIKVLEANK